MAKISPQKHTQITGKIWVTRSLGCRLAFESSASTRQLHHNDHTASLPTGHGTKQKTMW